MEIITKSENETFEFAKNFAKKLKGGEVIGLIGDLGAGKTVFTKGLAEGLGIKDNVSSPTFVVMKIYSTQNPKSKIQNLIHIDAYRLESENDLKNIGLDEYLNNDDCVIIVEWVDRIKKTLPKNLVLVTIKHKQNNKRKFDIKKGKN